MGSPEQTAPSDEQGGNTIERKFEEASRDVRNGVAKTLAGKEDPARYRQAAPVLARFVAEGKCNPEPATVAIEVILDAASDPIADPDLLHAITIGVDLELLVPHLEAAYPVDRPEPRTDMTLELADGHADRLRLLRIFRKLPPSWEIYDALRDYAREFDESPGFPGVDAPDPSESVSTYTGNVVRQYVSTPECVDTDLARRALQMYPSSAVEGIGDIVADAAMTDLYPDLRDAIRDHPQTREARQKGMANRLADAYLETDTSEKRVRLGVLLYHAIEDRFRLNMPQVLPALAEEMTGTAPAPALSAVLASSVVERETSLDGIAGNLEEDVADLAGVAASTIADGTDRWTMAELSKSDELSRTVRDLPLPMQPWRGTDKQLGAWASLSFRSTIQEEIPLTPGEVTHLLTVMLEGERPEVIEFVPAILSKARDRVPVRSAMVDEYPRVVERIPRVTDEATLEAIGDLLAGFEVYPAPPEIRELYGSTDEGIDSGAKSIRRRLRQIRSGNLPDVGPQEMTLTPNNVGDGFQVKYRCDDGVWRPLDLSAVDANLIAEVERCIDEGESCRLALPYHDPGAVVITLAGMAVSQIREDARICLYSPGTAGRWGTKGQIEKLYGRLAADDSTGPAVTVTPIGDFVPLVRPGRDGEVTVETDWVTVADDPSPLIIAKTWDEVVAAEPDAIVYNFVPAMDTTEATRLRRHVGDDGEGGFEDVPEPDDGIGSVGGLERVMNEAAHIELHGLFERVGYDQGAPRIGPPSPMENTTVPSPGDEDIGETVPPGSATREAHARELLDTPASITVRTVESDADTRSRLDRMHEAIGDLGDVQSEARWRALRSILAIKSEFETLPVPVGLHDSWIHEQRNEGNFYVPRTIDGRIRSLEEVSDDLPVGGQPVDIARQAADSLREELREENPLFRRLVTLLDEAIEAGERTAIMCAKKTHKDMLARHLEDATAGGPLRRPEIELVDPDNARDLEDVDRIVSFGVPSPRKTPLALHPAADQVDLLAYEGKRAVARLEEFIDRRRPFLAAVDGPVVPEPEVEGTETEVDVEGADSGSFGDALYRAHRAAETETAGLGHGGDGGTSLDRFVVTLDNGEERRLSDQHPVIVKADQQLVSSGEYVQRRLPELRPGDVMVDIDRETRIDLWEDYLRDHYEATDVEADFHAFLQGVEFWFDAVEKALSEAGGDRPWTDVADRLKEAGVEQDRATVREWARAVHAADNPGDLVFRGDLRIGPRDPEAVRIAGDELESIALENNWKAVHDRMSAFRTVNREEGKDFWNVLVHRANDGELFDEPGVIEAEIKGVERLN